MNRRDCATDSELWWKRFDQSRVVRLVPVSNVVVVFADYVGALVGLMDCHRSDQTTSHIHFFFFFKLLKQREREMRFSVWNLRRLSVVVSQLCPPKRESIDFFRVLFKYSALEWCGRQRHRTRLFLLRLKYSWPFVARAGDHTEETGISHWYTSSRSRKPRRQIFNWHFSKHREFVFS